MESKLTPVIDRLNAYVFQFKKEENALGYFASMYLRMTHAVEKAIGDRKFEDNERMERLVIIFAERYFTALDLYMLNKNPGKAWLVQNTRSSVIRPARSLAPML